MTTVVVRAIIKGSRNRDGRFNGLWTVLFYSDSRAGQRSVHGRRVCWSWPIAMSAAHTALLEQPWIETP